MEQVSSDAPITRSSQRLLAITNGLSLRSGRALETRDDDSKLLLNYVLSPFCLSFSIQLYHVRSLNYKNVYLKYYRIRSNFSSF